MLDQSGRRDPHDHNPAANTAPGHADPAAEQQYTGGRTRRPCR